LPVACLRLRCKFREAATTNDDGGKQQK